VDETREALFTTLREIRSLEEWATLIQADKVITTPYTCASTVLDLLQFIEKQERELSAQRERADKLAAALEKIAAIQEHKPVVDGGSVLDERMLGAWGVAEIAREALKQASTEAK
jgi:hypothetical protein